MEHGTVEHRGGMKNVDPRTVSGFGDEWTRFAQDALPDEERRRLFEGYFRVFPWETLPPDPVGCDFGCGSGRWAALVAPRVGKLHVLDASEDALAVARRSLGGLGNVVYHHASVSDNSLGDASLDFAYSLGVLHHVPDTESAVRAVFAKLKPGAPFLIYLYYAFDNRPSWYRSLWKGTDLARRVISSLPHGLRYSVSQVIAATVYWPLARSARVLDRAGLLHPSWPLASYRDLSFYTMRTDALDRFGTRLEKRFSREEIRALLEQAGFQDVVFSDTIPFWLACARRPAEP